MTTELTEPINILLDTGNLHLNIVAEAFTPEIEAVLEPFVFEVVR